MTITQQDISDALLLLFGIQKKEEEPLLRIRKHSKPPKKGAFTTIEAVMLCNEPLSRCHALSVVPMLTSDKAAKR